MESSVQKMVFWRFVLIAEGLKEGLCADLSENCYCWVDLQGLSPTLKLNQWFGNITALKNQKPDR